MPRVSHALGRAKGSRLAERVFSSQQISGITGLTARQLGYWRKTGLLSPRTRTPGGHARYSFTDLVALKTAKRLLDAGVSVQRIRRCLQSLIRFLPTIDKPLHELSLVATGDVVLVLHSRSAFDALTGQDWILEVADVVQEAERIKRDAPTPRQCDLFSDLEQEVGGTQQLRAG